MLPEGRWLCVSLHDVAPATWDRCQRVLRAVREVADIPLTLLVVPAYHGECSGRPEFEAAMSEQLDRGHELALHGYFHCDPQQPCDLVDWLQRRVYTLEGEFSALNEREAAERMYLGRRWFTANGWPIAGFVPPAWLMGPGAWSAMHASREFLYTTTLTQMHLLAPLQSLRAPCLTYSLRAWWRRVGSLAFNAALARTVDSMPLVRLGLHPADADDAAARGAWQRLLGRLLERRRAATKAAYARHWQLALGAAQTTSVPSRQERRVLAIT
jgi:predicted deacetylase